MKIGNFPEVVNDNAARITASFVFFTVLLALYLHSWILTAFLIYGFAARVLYGPRFDLFARVALHGIIPAFKIGNKPTAGPPKRFAQSIGFVFSVTATALALSGQYLGFTIVLSVLAFFAFLEAFLGFCAGCFVFGILMKAGIIPEEICERCNNLSFEKP